MKVAAVKEISADDILPESFDLLPGLVDITEKQLTVQLPSKPLYN